MSLARGHLSTLIVAPETTYGTAATTGWKKSEIISMSCDPDIGVIPDPSLYNARTRRGLYQGGLVYRGTIRMRANYEGGVLRELLRAAMLNYAFVQVGAGPPVTNGHTFTDGTTLRSLTGLFQEGGVAATMQQAVGMVITGFTFRVTPGEGPEAMGQYEFTYIAKAKTTGITEPTISVASVTTTISTTGITRASGSWYTDGVMVGATVTGTGINAGTTVAAITSATAITLSQNATASGTVTLQFSVHFPAVNPVIFHAGSTYTDGSGDTPPQIIKSLEVTYTAPYAEDRYRIGSISIEQPIPNDFVVARMRITREFDSLNMFNKAASFSDPSTPIQFIFQGATIQGANKFETEFRMQSAKPVEYSNPIDDYGIVEATATWEAYFNPADVTGLLVRIQNTTADVQLT